MIQGDRVGAGRDAHRGIWIGGRTPDGLGDVLGTGFAAPDVRMAAIPPLANLA